MKQVLNRMKKPTPKFFIKLRNIGLTAGTIGAALLSQPDNLPAAVLKIAEHLTVVGAITGILSQSAVKDDE